jgi:hypothetical protein
VLPSGELGGTVSGFAGPNVNVFWRLVSNSVLETAHRYMVSKLSKTPNVEQTYWGLAIL